jgi:hypothetical protein
MESRDKMICHAGPEEPVPHRDAGVSRTFSDHWMAPMLHYVPGCSLSRTLCGAGMTVYSNPSRV